MPIEIPGYRLAEPLAHGRRGPLRAGVQLDNHQRVVVHLVKSRLDRAARSRLQARVRKLRDLPPAPAVVPLLTGGTTVDGHVFLVTPRMDRSLADLLDADGPLPLDLVVSAGSAVIDALRVLHGRDVVHGNITPANLLIRPDGDVALTGPRIEVLDEVAGAGPVVHWPPEAARGGEWTTAGDVYMVGSTLWTLLAGRPPYPDLPALLRQRLPALDRGDTPAELAGLIRRMLASDPADRPSDTTGITRSLQAIVATAATGEVRTGDPEARPRRDVADTDRLFRPALAGSPGRADRVRTIGRYRIRERLGTGGSATVWRAEDERGRVVAVKELRPQFRAHPDAAYRFRQELALLPELNHAHLVPALEIIMTDDDVALVMPLYGADLRKVLTSARMETKRYVEVLRQVATALAFLHQRGVLHRDVKPDNVLVERRDPVLVRLTDFGIARILDLPGVTASDGPPGTLPYMAPELFGGGPATPAIDVYAFGVMTYELLTGARPFAGTHAEVVNGHLHTPPPRAAAVSEQAWHLLVRCLDKRVAARPAADDLAKLLRALPEAGLGGPSAAPTVRHAPQPFPIASTTPLPLPSAAPLPAPSPAVVLPAERRRTGSTVTASRILDVVADPAPAGAAPASRPGKGHRPASADRLVPPTATMVKAAVAVVVTGVLLGVLWTLRGVATDPSEGTRQTPPPSTASAVPSRQRTVLAATATSPRRGVISVSWSTDPRAGVAAATIVVVHDPTPGDPAGEGDLSGGDLSFDATGTEHIISALDGDTQYCVTVLAYVPDDAAQVTSTPAGSTCLVPDGGGQLLSPASPHP